VGVGEGPHIPANYYQSKLAKLVVKMREKHTYVTQKYANKNILEPREGWRWEWGGAMAGIVVEGKDVELLHYPVWVWKQS
jgi:hypothetical protein